MPHETKDQNFPISQWAEDDRPREKLLTKGRTALSDAELIAILISTGSRKESAVDVSKKLLALGKNKLLLLGRMSVKDLCGIKGIGEAKAVTIIAALELGRRRKEEAMPENMFIRSSSDLFRFFDPLLSDLPHEEFWILLLNRTNKIIAHKKISEGGISGTIADIRIIFKYCLENLATSLILCHNHPSGNVQPSAADKQLTSKIAEAGKLFDITLLDHIIAGEKQYFSFADDGLL